MAYRQQSNPRTVKPVNTRPVRRAPPSIARASANIFANLAKKTKYVDPTLAARWPSLVGPKIANLCRPGRITGRGTERTLEISVPSGAAAAQVQMQADDILANVNTYLGPNAVARLSIRQNGRTPAQSAAPAPAKPTPAQADEGPLGSALASFRSAIARRDGDK